MTSALRAALVRHAKTGLMMSSGLSLLLLPFIVRACQRPVAPSAPTRDDMAVALRVARTAATGAITGREAASDGSTLDTGGALGGVPAGPVVVTIHGVGLVERRVPPHGVWYRGGGSGVVTLADAIRAAAADAGAKCRERRIAAERLEAARIKVDIGGEVVYAWSSSEGYLSLIVNPGLDGLVGFRGGEAAYIPPSWIVERGWWRLGGALRYLKAVLGGPDVDIEVGLFRARSFIEGVPDEPGPLPVVRANVLLDALDIGVVQRSIRTAGEYLARMVGPDGRYCYTYFAGRDRCDRDYNLLRHAGTTYSLYQAYREFGDPDMLEAAERAAQWLRGQVRPVTGHPDRVYMIEGKRAKLGAIGLGLLALVERQKAVEDDRDRELMTRMANFVLSQQRPNGFLESWFDWGPGADVPETNSIYYPGEALLGLVRLYGIDPEQRWLDAAVKAARYLARDRWRWGGIELYVPPDAWLTQGLAELHAYVPDPLFEDYAYEIVEVTDVTQLRAEEGADPDLAGGPAFGLFMPTVTPAGSRNEGLVAAYRMAVRAGRQEKAAWIKDLSFRSARFQVAHQFRAANSFFLPNPAKALGGFRSRPDKLDVRIDYVQHNLTGLLGVLQMLREEGGGP